MDDDVDVVPDDTYSMALENLTLNPLDALESNEDQNLENDLLNHVLLPRFLPQRKKNNLNEVEMGLFLRMVELIDVNEGWIPAPTVNMFKNFYNVQVDCQPATIFNQINGIKPGDTFAMFVSGQNCMLVIYMPIRDDDNPEPDDSTTVIVATFPGNFEFKGIYSHIGDLEFNYPMQALKVKYSRLLRSMEFADQLYGLHNDLPESSTQLVSNWLVETLCDDEATAATLEEFPVITKKLHDEVIGISIQRAFRRSRIYICAKSLLQHSLTIQWGEDTGRQLYKIIMLQFIAKVFKSSNNQTCDTSLMNMMMAKLARRIKKLSKLDNEFKDHNADDADLLMEIRVGVVFEAKSTIKELRKRINTQIDKLQSEDENAAKLLELSNLNFEDDVNQKVAKLREYLNKRLSPTSASDLFSRNAPKYIRHNLKPHNALPAGYFVNCNNATEKNLQLIDFENVVLHDLDLNDAAVVNAKAIRNNAFLYRDASEPHYKDDPLATSRMILVQLKQIAMLDGVVCDRFPLLLKHRSGINPNIIKALLLPQFVDMKIADELEEYFRKRNTASGPSLIEEKNVSVASFGAAFAAQDDRMGSYRKTMLRETKENIERLQQEWTNARHKVSGLREAIRDMSHRSIKASGKRRCVDCDLCKLKRQIKNVKLEQYMKPLPENEHEQNALIFERYIPEAIAHLRDVLHSFTEYCSGKPKNKLKITTKETKKTPKKANKTLPHSNVFGLNGSDMYNVCLGSTKCVDKGSLHVDKPFEMFVLENDCDCTFHASEFPMPGPIADDSIKGRCTLKVEEGSDYEQIQWMINGTSHTENEVLAAQSKCPDGLSFAEFKSFGCLRADGYRLQLRKLYGLIETEALSLEQPSVLSLIMQTIWECEEKGESGATRETYNDLNCKAFSLSLLKLLSRFIERQKDNWINPVKLVMASFIIVRIMEISRNDEAISDEIVKILNDLRIVAMDWIEKIQEAICELESPDQAIEQSLRIKLAMAAFAGIVTFFVHPSHEFHRKILQPNERNGYSAYRMWLQFIITLNNNILLNEDSKTKFDLHMIMFLRLVLNVGVQLEMSMKKIISSSTFTDLPELIRKQWKNAVGAEIKTSNFDYECPQIICTEVNEKIVKIYIVTGDFLVNDLPVARLPRKISDDPLYARIFQNFSFEIQLEDANAFCTLHKYKNCVYKFSCKAVEGIVITECSEDGIERELLPISVLEAEIPYLLVGNYSHWWNKNENTVDFRPKFFNDKRFSTEDGVEYRLHLDNNRLTHLETNRNLLDVTSYSYLNIVKQLSRLGAPELHKYSVR